MNTTSSTAARPRVRLVVRLAPYVGVHLRHRLEVVSGVEGCLVAGWYDSRREALRAGRRWARDNGFDCQEIAP